MNPLPEFYIGIFYNPETNQVKLEGSAEVLSNRIICFGMLETAKLIAEEKGKADAQNRVVPATTLRGLPKPPEAS